MTAQALCNQALELHRRGALDDAERLYRQALAADPSAFAPRHYLGVLKLQQGHTGEALELIAGALKIQPDSAEARINYGNALKLVGRNEDALEQFARVQMQYSAPASAPYNRAILLAALGRLDEALAGYDEAITIRPDFFEALYERALLLLHMERLEEALAALERTLVLRPRDAETLNSRGVALHGLGRFEEALSSIEQALVLAPNSAEAWHNRGNALTKLKRLDEALASFDRALALKPDAYARAWSNRGTLLRDMRRMPEAIASFDRALAIDPDFVEALYHRARLVWSELRDYRAARAGLERVLALKPDYPLAAGDLLYLKMQACDWQGQEADIARIDAGVRAGKPVIEPFIYQAVSQSPQDLQTCSQTYTARLFPARPMTRPPRAGRTGKIRLGYLSGEFRAQATAFLTAGLYECHDRSRFEVIAFDNGVSDHSPTRERLEAAFDGWVDISRLSDAQAAERIASEKIDILVNLNGYFGEKRMGVFAMKPASSQVNFLGFPMTLGAPYMDYIIADRVVIPQSEERWYSEKVVTLPDTYQVNDSRRAIADAAPSRAECDLPAEGFVFCSFNQAYKLTPEMFAVWMRILKAVAGSVLWLLDGPPELRANLRQAAAAAGVGDERIIFAPLIPVEQHLARLRLADLFLDTLPCNAHTTASDALWAGVPLLTCRGHAFSGRVAASLLSAIGLAELICGDISSYEALAIRLAGDRTMLGELRQRLARNRAEAPLFDTQRYCAHLEAGYEAMQARQEAGQPPAAIKIKPLK
jgi:predicted O-linked N-acetylglucosamine transferase (SPINDLY family)